MTRSRTARRHTIAALAAAGVAPWIARAADPVKLKFTGFEPPMANITSNVLTPFAREASAGSNGTLQIDMFAGGTLGRNPLTQMKLVTDGVADVGWVVLPYTPGRFDDTEVVGLPFVTRNSIEASLALHVPVGVTMGIAGVVGFGLLAGFGPAFATIASETSNALASLDLATIPLFVLMGSFASAAGSSEDL